MYWKWASILRLFLIKGKTVSSKMYYIFLKVVESMNVAVVSRSKQLSWVVDNEVLGKVEHVLRIV